MPASARLFCNGNAMFFDDNGKQITEMQRGGLCGLYAFSRRYPSAPVYWSIWREVAHEIDLSLIPYLLCCLREEREPLKDEREKG